jgi:phosphomevalonate kinase
MTQRPSHRVSAPGKLMVSGEYAVLEGAEAVVAAVDRRAYVQLNRAAAQPATSASHTQPTLPPEVLSTRACVEARFGPVPGALSVDVSELQQGGKKLGLGSSAAAAAATAAALLRAHGRDLADPAARALCLELSLQGHRAVAPEGSGADVAASVLGGFVRFRKLGEGVDAQPHHGAELELALRRR